jgi:hypothetical protein
MGSMAVMHERTSGGDFGELSMVIPEAKDRCGSRVNGESQDECLFVGLG